jgi:hypothetical protein
MLGWPVGHEVIAFTYVLRMPLMQEDEPITQLDSTLGPLEKRIVNALTAQNVTLSVCPSCVTVTLIPSSSCLFRGWLDVMHRFIAT